MSELPHTLSIIQGKLKALQERRIEHVQKIATKRSLLQQSYSVLQTDLKMSLAQDKRTLHSISNQSINPPLVPLIPTAIDSEAQPKIRQKEEKQQQQQHQQLFELIECHGWIRSGQVILRACGIPLLDCRDISQAHLWLPNCQLSPEDVRLNTRYNLLPSTKHVFYCSFPLLEDQDDEDDLEDILITCVYKVNNVHYTSEPIPIRWSNNKSDTAWLDSKKVLSVYFTCHVRVKQTFSSDILKKLKLKSVKEDDSLLLSKDQSLLVHIINSDIFDIYGFNASKLASIAKPLNVVQSEDDLNKKKDLILSLGDEYLCFGTSDYPNARAKMDFFMATAQS